MRVGLITVDGQRVGFVSLDAGPVTDTFAPDLDGYFPEGRASERPQGIGPDGTAPHGHTGHHRAPEHAHQHAQRPHHHAPEHHAAPEQHRQRFGGEGDLDPPVQHDSGYKPKGDTYGGGGGHPVQPGSAETDQAIVDASRAHGQDPNFMRSVGSIESGNNPSSNANRSTQYKGLYQIGRDEWRRFGAGGNIYSAQDNAMAAARMFDENRKQFKKHFNGRDPTDTEQYLMHQQGLGFYTRGAMTNIHGNPYPGMHGPQTHESFEEGWGREVARRKAGFAARNHKEAEAKEPADVTFDPGTMAP